jgi:hypothetical protein
MSSGSLKEKEVMVYRVGTKALWKRKEESSSRVYRHPAPADGGEAVAQCIRKGGTLTRGVPQEPVVMRRTVDHDCTQYQALVADVRSTEHCKRNHGCRVLGMEEVT